MGETVPPAAKGYNFYVWNIMIALLEQRGFVMVGGKEGYGTKIARIINACA